MTTYSILPAAPRPTWTPYECPFTGELAVVNWTTKERVWLVGGSEERALMLAALLNRPVA